MTYQSETERQAASRRTRQLAERRRRARQGYKIDPAAHEIRRGLGKCEPPEDVLLDRDRRSAVPLTPAQRLCGDPDPLRSARMAELNDQHLQRVYAERARKWHALGATIVAGFIVAMSITTQAHASWIMDGRDYRSQYSYHERGARTERVYGHRSAARYARRSRFARNLSAPCRRAAALGGPCGCVASIHFFGASIRRLWPVSEWLAEFERTTARANVAAIWPNHHHVAQTVSGPHNGRIMVADSWATHEVSMRGLIFVDPRSPRARRRRYAEVAL